MAPKRLLEAIEAWLAEHRRKALPQEIAAYAAQVAGTEADLGLDPRLAASSIEAWLTAERRR